MNKLTEFEISKVFHNKAFYICMIISAVLAVAGNAAIVMVADMFGAAEINGSAFSSMQDFTTYAMTSLLLSVMVPLIASEDFSNETIKNIYAKGLSRKDVYLSKFAAALIAALIFCLADVAASGITGLVLYGMGTMESNFVLSMTSNIICLLSLSSVYFMATMIIGKAGASIAACIVGPQIITMVLSLLTTVLKLENMDLSDYWITNIADKAADYMAIPEDLTKYIVIAVIYLIVSTIAGVVLTSRKEV